MIKHCLCPTCGGSWVGDPMHGCPFCRITVLEAENARLRELVKKAYDEAYMDGPAADWETSDACAALARKEG